MKITLKRNMKSKTYSFFLVTSFLTYITKDFVASRVTPSRNLADKQTLESPSPSTQQTIYTFIDYENRRVDKDQLKLWPDRWTESGWHCEILTPSDSKKYNNYDKAIYRLDVLKVNDDERNKHLRYMAMSALSDGGLFANYFVLPLYDNQVELPLTKQSEKDDIIFVSLDAFSDSFLLGNFNGWNKAAEIVLKSSHIKSSVLKNLEDKMAEMSTANLVVQLNPDNNHFVVSMGRASHRGTYLRHASVACQLAKDHFAINMLPGKRRKSAVSSTFMQFYDKQCFLNREGISERLALLVETFQENRPLDFTHSILHQTDVIHEDSKSEVKCNGNSCEIRNACITSSSGIALFGSRQHVEQEKAKLIGYVKQGYSADYSHNNLYDITSRGQGTHGLKKSVATMGLGLQNYHCDDHFQHVIWPLIRMNLYRRGEKDVLTNGVGDLFLEIIDTFSCAPLYSPMSEKVSLYKYIPEGVMKCYSQIFVGTSLATGKHLSNFHEDIRSMRSLYFNYFNVDGMTKRDTIVITKSSNLHNIEKMHDVIEKLILSIEPY